MMKCPVCLKVYSYGRMISHRCGGNTLFFGSIFDGTTREYQWNYSPHPTATTNEMHCADAKKPTRSELHYQDEHHKILYPWNCRSKQDDSELVLHLTISDKQLIYE